MKNIKFNNILRCISIGALILSIFIFLCPVLSFTVTNGDIESTFQLSGIALFKNDATASLIGSDFVDIYVTDTFCKSEVLISLFSFLIIAITLQILNIFVKKPKNYQFITNTFICLICLLNFTLALAFPFSYYAKGYILKIDYGSILLMILTGVALFIELYLSITPFLKAKNNKD